MLSKPPAMKKLSQTPLNKVDAPEELPDLGRRPQVFSLPAAPTKAIKAPAALSV